MNTIRTWWWKIAGRYDTERLASMRRHPSGKRIGR